LQARAYAQVEPNRPERQLLDREVFQLTVTVADVLDPDVNACGLVTLPNEKHAWYRVRPFYYGAQSNVAHQVID